MKFSLNSNGKINIGLNITGKREDGYHFLDMVMVPINLSDKISGEIEDISGKLTIETNKKDIPTGKENILYKIYDKFYDESGIERKKVNIYLEKRIPHQAGLGGGSSNGAFLLKLLNEFHGNYFAVEKLIEIGKSIGADIPFCIYEKTAFVEGVGEKLQFIDEPFEAYLLLVKPKKGVSTQKAFTSLDLSKVKHQDCRKMKKGIEMNDYQAVIDNLQNTLELPSIKMVPQIKEIKKEMMKLGFDGALMSGSGSCVFGITRNQEIMNKGYEFFRKRYFFVRKSKILNK